MVVRYLSEAYFEIFMANNDETRRVMALGEAVSFRMGSTTVEISPTEGVESLDADTRSALGL